MRLFQVTVCFNRKFQNNREKDLSGLWRHKKWLPVFHCSHLIMKYWNLNYALHGWLQLCLDCRTVPLPHLYMNSSKLNMSTFYFLEIKNGILNVFTIYHNLMFHHVFKSVSILSIISTNFSRKMTLNSQGASCFSFNWKAIQPSNRSIIYSSHENVSVNQYGL